jgi:sugar phosphate isomerase/epimerase
MRDELNRRDFLRAAGIGLGSLAIAGCVSRARDPQAEMARTRDTDPRLAYIGVQLYSVRDLMKADMAGTLAALAGIGYQEVEFAGYFDRSPADIRAMLDRVRLSAPSAHVPLETLRSNLPGVLDAAATIGHSLVICPYAKLATLDEWRALADEFNRIGAACNERNIRFGYHNHDHEFVAIDGQMPYEILTTRAEPNLVALEMDLFWAVKAGQDPVVWFERFPGRFPAVHVKDMRGIHGAQEMVAVGEGEIDFARIFAAAKTAGLVHYIVEHDNPTDPIASVRTSYGHLHDLLA